MAIILNRTTFFRQSSLLLAVSALFFAQPPQPAAAQARQQITASPAPPEVAPDRRITFRVASAKASDVQLLWQQKLQPMTKGKDGIWSVTVDPSEPDIYNYSFLVEGVRVGAGTVDVPGTPPRFDEIQKVPHGSVTIHSYFATAQDKERGLYVYLPPQYYTDTNRKFPVLYLWHGGQQNESDWTRNGRTNIILDNLIAQKKAVPMIVVMPNNDVDSDRSSVGASAILAKELQADIIPLVEKDYRVLSGRNDRAITGLSFGGGTSFHVGTRHLDMFGYIGEFSAGVWGGLDPPAPGHGFYGPYEPPPGLYENLVSPTKKPKLFYMSVGTDDPRRPFQEAALADFQKHGIQPVFKTFPGAHEWKVWRRSLADFATMLFQ